MPIHALIEELASGRFSFPGLSIRRRQGRLTIELALKIAFVPDRCPFVSLRDLASMAARPLGLSPSATNSTSLAFEAEMVLSGGTVRGYATATPCRDSAVSRLVRVGYEILPRAPHDAPPPEASPAELRAGEELAGDLITALRGCQSLLADLLRDEILFTSLVREALAARREGNIETWLSFVTDEAAAPPHSALFREGWIEAVFETLAAMGRHKRSGAKSRMQPSPADILSEVILQARLYPTEAAWCRANPRTHRLAEEEGLLLVARQVMPKNSKACKDVKKEE